jgi:hypothetical protein
MKIIQKTYFKIITQFLKGFEYFSGEYYFSFLKRERFSQQVTTLDFSKNSFSDTAIIMQGQVIKKDNFTLNTVLIYKKRYPNALIIVSTWEEHESKELIEFAENNDFVILFNIKPLNSGISNINLQIISTKNGIEFAKSRGVKYCVKTRTDQRIYKKDFLNFLNSTRTFFNNNKILADYGLNDRIIITSLNTYKFRLYGPSDMFMYGHIDDIFKYWDVELDNRILNQLDINNTVIGWSQASLCEVYLCINYLQRINYEFNWSIYDSWSVLANFFIVIDKLSIDLFWFKYNRWFEFRYYTNIAVNLTEEFMFSDWVSSVDSMSNYNQELESLLLYENMSENINF